MKSKNNFQKWLELQGYYRRKESKVLLYTVRLIKNRIIVKKLTIPVVSHCFSKQDLWDAWWASAIKIISFSGVDKEHERRCFEEFYKNKLASSNGG